MTVATLNSTYSASGNGTLKEFTFDFALLAESHLDVYIISASGTSTLQSDYTLDDYGSEGGTITFSEDATPAATETVFFQRNVPVTQETDYLPNDPFPAEVHEDSLDKLTMLIQDSSYDISRCITVPFGDTATDLELPFATSRASSYLYFDANGDVTTTSTTAGDVYSTSEIDTLFSDYYTSSEIDSLFDAIPDYYNVVGDWNKQQYFGTATITGTWNLDDSQVAEWTLASGTNTASNPTNMKAGGSYMLFIRQDAGGSRTITWGDAYVWEADAAPVISASALETTIIVFISDGTYMYGTMQFKESG